MKRKLPLVLLTLALILLAVLIINPPLRKQSMEICSDQDTEQVRSVALLRGQTIGEAIEAEAPAFDCEFGGQATVKLTIFQHLR